MCTYIRTPWGERRGAGTYRGGRPTTACFNTINKEFGPELRRCTVWINSLTWVSWYQNVSSLDFIGAKGDGGGEW